MTISEIMRRLPDLKDHHEYAHCIDFVRLVQVPHRHGLMMILHRAYKGMAEKCDIETGKAPWVKFRQALNQPTGVNEYE